jgi:flagellar biosynthesis/type III secretory pathway protein FliH
MSDMLTIQLAGPIKAVRLVDAPTQSPSAAPHMRNPKSEIRNSEAQELAPLCKTVKSIVDQLNKIHDETVASHRSEIARLAVEIARKILACKTARGDYDLQAVIEEALKRAPTRQNIVVHVNPEDLAPCQRLVQDNPDGPLAGLEFVADWSIARADCLVETPKGIVKAFVEEHLERISEALMQVGRP